VLSSFLLLAIPIFIISLPSAYADSSSSSSDSSASSSPTINTCRDKMVDELSKVHDDFRSYVFGSRLDRDGKFSVLTGGNVDAERRGILTATGRLTSELVPPLVESYRVLRCRSFTVCKVVSASMEKKGGAVTVRPLGCGEQTIDRYKECYLANDQDQSGSPLSDQMSLSSYCDQTVTDSLAMERRLLQMVVAYDAGYRSFLQLAGMIEWLESKLTNEVLYPFRDMVNLLGRLHQIPCFIGQCDYPDISNFSASSLPSGPTP